MISETSIDRLIRVMNQVPMIEINNYGGMTYYGECLDLDILVSVCVGKGFVINWPSVLVGERDVPHAEIFRYQIRKTGDVIE
jgi:hypothetical protein